MAESKGLLAGKNCVITSGAHGMGYSIALLFAKQGGRVAICGRSPSGAESGEKLAAISPGSFFFPCDMGEQDQVYAFADEVLRRFGTVDVLVNNVGINKKERIAVIDLETYYRIYRVNLHSTLHILQKFLPTMQKQGSGSIIHIASMNALAPAPTTGTYSSTKGAIISLSRVLASEIGKYGLRSNVLCPGWVATTYIESDLRQAEEEGRSLHDVLEGYDGSSPLMAPARPGDIANHALFLASDRSSYITGATIRCDGAAVMQAHECDFPRPPQEAELKKDYFDSILREYGIRTEG